jgi:sulfite reductase beta subunit-like hemoprotein
VGQEQAQEADGGRRLIMADRGPAAEKRLKIVFCGGCNPQIDRTAVAADLPADDPGVPSGTTVHLSGCPRACASDHQLVADGDRTSSPAP